MNKAVIGVVAGIVVILVGVGVCYYLYTQGKLPLPAALTNLIVKTRNVKKIKITSPTFIHCNVNIIDYTGKKLGLADLTATQSSTYAKDLVNNGPNRMIDDDPTGMNHTANESGDWALLEFKVPTKIKSVEIIGRSTWPSRQNGVKIELYDETGVAFKSWVMTGVVSTKFDVKDEDYKL
ncbi:hypothetical protein [Carp edema virus]|nr:hypothetical protein [Carp edema virus]